MAYQGASYEPPADEERSVLLVHPHWKTILRPLSILVVTVAAALAIVIVIPSGSATQVERLAVLAAAVIIMLIWAWVPILRWKMTTYELTTRRLRLREGVLSRKGRDFPLLRISE